MKDVRYLLWRSLFIAVLLLGILVSCQERQMAGRLEQQTLALQEKAMLVRSTQEGTSQLEARSSTAVKSVFDNWGLEKIQISESWQMTEQAKDVVVAVIDTGVDIRHPDLAGGFWTNPGETGRDSLGHSRENNEIDDDANGFIDDVHGWNFAEDNNDIRDDIGHGTHIAGIIAGTGAVRVKGVAPNVRLMIIKYYGSGSTGANTLDNTVRGIRYAVQMGAQIINYSGGGITPSAAERAAIVEAGKRGVLFVGAAGNERSNSDMRPFFPADYGLTNIISVTALNPSGNVLATSNFGEHSVDVAAPGENILSTLPEGHYGVMTGTSQATAFVTGVAALLKSSRDDLRTPERMREQIIATGESLRALLGKTRKHTELNALNALVMADAETTACGNQTLQDDPSADALITVNDETEL